jgi:NAD+ synthase
MSERAREAGSDGFVVGLSGGIDSSVVLALAARAMPSRVVGIIMPCESEELDRQHALIAAEGLPADVETVRLDETYHRLLKELPDEGDRMARSNIKARLRMAGVYFFANARNYLVAGTGNRSELVVGYYTKFGDGACDLLPIGDLLKTDVQELASFLEISEEIISKPPSAGLWPGQTDEEELGMEYSTIDEIIRARDEDRDPGVAPEAVEKLRRMEKASHHKRTTPPVCEMPAEVRA